MKNGIISPGKVRETELSLPLNLPYYVILYTRNEARYTKIWVGHE